MEKIRVIIIEDDLIWLKEMIGFLNREDDIVIVGTASSRTDAVNLARIMDVDVYLIDIMLDEGKYDGICIASEIMSFSAAKIIMITSLKEESFICDAFAAGAVYYIAKENYRSIPMTIQYAHSNCFSPIEILAKKYAQLRKEEQLNVLTKSEKELYRLIDMGLTQSQVRKKLYITKNTLKTHIKSILVKLGARSMKEAITIVNSIGVLNLDKNLKKG